MKKVLIKLIRLPLTIVELLFIAGRIGYHFYKMKTAKDRPKKCRTNRPGRCKHDLYKSATFTQHKNFKVDSGHFWYSCRNCDYSKEVKFTKSDIKTLENERLRSLART